MEPVEVSVFRGSRALRLRLKLSDVPLMSAIWLLFHGISGSSLVVWKGAGNVVFAGEASPRCKRRGTSLHCYEACRLFSSKPSLLGSHLDQVG